MANTTARFTIKPFSTVPTKTQELSILDAAIAALGPQSYLGPWLTQVKAEVIASIRSDHFPSISLADTRQQIESSIADARVYAEQIKAEANRRDERARDEVNERRVEAARLIVSATQELQRVAHWLDNRF